MGNLDVSVSVQSEGGPLLDGTATPIIRDWLDSVKQDIADEAVADLRGFLMDKTGRATGAYQEHLTTRRTSQYNDVIVYDAFPTAVYGPWLEGFSERNRSTRFKGYHLWRLTRQRVSQRARGIAERRLPELAEKLGGGRFGGR